MAACKAVTSAIWVRRSLINVRFLTDQFYISMSIELTDRSLQANNLENCDVYQLHTDY